MGIYGSKVGFRGGGWGAGEETSARKLGQIWAGKGLVQSAK